MAPYTILEVSRVVARAAETRELLHVPREARRIAFRYGLAPADVARELMEAGVRARINMEFGPVDRPALPTPAVLAPATSAKIDLC